MSGRIVRATDQRNQARHRARTGELERRLNVSQSDLRPAPVPSGGGVRSVEIVVAAADSSDAAKATADYVCTGTNDHLVIQAALDECYAYAWGGTVLLLAGSYSIGVILTVDGNVTLRGLGLGTYLGGTSATSGTGLIEVVDYDVGIHDMSLAPWGTYAITYSGSVLSTFISGIYTASTVKLANASHITLSEIGVVEFDGVGSSIDGSVGIGDRIIFGSSSARNKATGCTARSETVGNVVSMDGTDNTCQAVTVYGRVSSNNTAQLVSLTGTRNRFSDCTVRSSNGSFAPKYAVEVLAGASGAIVKRNDLRPGTGAWGTSAFFDGGSGTLAADNDT